MKNSERIELQCPHGIIIKFKMVMSIEVLSIESVRNIIKRNSLASVNIRAPSRANYLLKQYIIISHTFNFMLKTLTDITILNLIMVSWGHRNVVWFFRWSWFIHYLFIHSFIHLTNLCMELLFCMYFRWSNRLITHVILVWKHRSAFLFCSKF